MEFHRGIRYQRGAGFASLFSGLWRVLKPIASMGVSAGKKLLSSDFAHKLGNTALDIGKQSVTNLVTDLLEGVPIKESAQNQLEEAKSKISQAIKGGGKRKRKKKCTKVLPVKKSCYSLID